MGPTVIGGLPAHVLLVHIVVVLVPLTALLMILVVAWPAARRRLGVVTPIVALVTLIAVPLTTHAGEWLERHVPRDPLVQAHADLGDQMLPWAAVAFVVTTVWWLIHHRGFTAQVEQRSPRAAVIARHRALALSLAVVAVVVAVGSVVTVYRIGDSGARAAWHDQFSHASVQ